MKRLISAFGYTLFVLVALLPFGTAVASLFGYSFELVSVPAFAVVLALLSVGLTVLSLREKEACGGGAKVLFALLTPLSLINAVFYLFESGKLWVAVCVCICVGCSIFLTVRHGKPVALKVIALVLSAFMVLPAGFWGFIALTFRDIGKNTVVQAVDSPNGRYCVEVIDSDQGTLGGDTLVEVYEKTEINALLFRLSKKPRNVYHGDWKAYETLELSWKDDGCLIINSAEYEIDEIE